MRTILGVALVMAAGAAVMACASPANEDASRQEGEIGGSESLVSVVDASDFGNLVRLRGHVRIGADNEAKLSLRNESRAGRPEITTHVITAAHPGMTPVDEHILLAEDPSAPQMPAAGDCVSVTNLSNPARGGAPAEFAAFAYSYRDGRGDPHPSWATNGSKIYRSAKECLADPERAAIPAAAQKLIRVWDNSDFGNVFGIHGAVGFIEGAAELVLRNESRPAANGEDGIAHVSVAAPPGGGMGIYEFQTSVTFGDPGSTRVPADGECVSVSTAGLSARGTGLLEIGAFTYHHIDGRGVGQKPALFASSKECLAASK